MKSLADAPTGDARVLPLVEALLDDLTPCQISIPFSYAEIRWLATRALVAERFANGLREPMRIAGMILPQSNQDLYDIMDAHLQNVPADADALDGPDRRKKPALNYGLLRDLERFALLRERGLLPLYDLEVSGEKGYVEFTDLKRVHE